MHIKRFEGIEMRAILREIREELGPDALVVSTRTHRPERSWFGKLSQPVIEVTAALDREHHAPPGAAADAEDGAVRRGRPDPSWNELRLTRALVSPLEGEIRSLRAIVERLAVREASEGEAQLALELKKLRRLTADASAPAIESRAASIGPYAAPGLSARHRASLSAELASGDVCAGGSPERRVLHALAARLDEMLHPPRLEEGAVLYVGPPGAGKTTTLAKIAGREVTQGEDVALLSTDTHRIGASAVLRGYAKHLGVPFETALSSAGLSSASSPALASRRRVLIDTAGRSRHDTSAIAELQGFREALGSRARVCLVLPATMKEEDMRRDIERYRPLSPETMILTKVDESHDIANVANLLLDRDCPPLAWIGTGQRVPTDLHVAEPEDLAERILGAAA